MTEEQLDIAKQIFESKRKYLNSLSPSEAKRIATEYLIAIGALDAEGNQIPFNQEEFDNSQHPINFRKM